MNGCMQTLHILLVSVIMKALFYKSDPFTAAILLYYIYHTNNQAFLSSILLQTIWPVSIKNKTYI